MLLNLGQKSLDLGESEGESEVGAANDDHELERSNQSQLVDMALKNP